MQAPQLYIIGLGIQIPVHTTPQAMQALALCQRVYAIVQENPELWLPEKRHAGLEIVNLLKSYEEGQLRSVNYDRAASMIMGGLAQDQPTAYVTYGNPLVYDSVGQSLVRLARDAGLPFSVVPGISSIETMLCDLGVDMAPGIQIHEASWLVAAQVPLSPIVAALILQIGTFGSLRAHYRKLPDASSLGGLVEYLSQWYPESHSVSLVRSGGHVTDIARIRTVALQHLTKVKSEDLLNASLYLPSLADTQVDERVITEMSKMPKNGLDS